MFDRWQCGWERTWAYWLFKKHHTELNSIYWAHFAASNNSLKTIKGFSPETLIYSVFPVSQDDRRRICFTVEQWRDQYKDFNNWVNLSAAVSLVSYLEIYMQSVVTLAIESDPAVLLGASRSVDGAKFLKNKTNYSFADRSLAVMKGTWCQRANAYKEYFGSLPTILETSLDELDELRKLRNGVGHTFGRQVDVYQIAKISIKPQAQLRLSQTRLKKWLGLVENVATAVDDHLRNSHIGAYELICYFNKWLKETKKTTFDFVPFKEHVHTLIGVAPNKEYFKSLSLYFSNL